MRSICRSDAAAVLLGLALLLRGGGAAAAPGTLDPTYNGTGLVRLPFGPGQDQTSAAVLQPDGRLLVAGTSYTGSSAYWCVLRYNVDGSPDPAFGAGGRALLRVGDRAECTAMRLQSDGGIVLAGVAAASPIAGQHVAVARLLGTGEPDPGFGVGGVVTTTVGSLEDRATDVRIQTDGRILVCGQATPLPGLRSEWFVLRYLSTGQLDPSFAGDGHASVSFGTKFDRAYAMTLQGDGAIVVVGSTEVVTFTDHLALARLTPAGALDPTFDGDGRVVTSFLGHNDVARGVAIYPGTPTTPDRLIVAGHSRTGANADVVLLARYSLNGTLDATFDGDGWKTTPLGNFAQAYKVLVVSSGLLGRKVVITGGAGTNASSILTARYNADGTLDTTFDGDGIALATIGGFFETGQAVLLHSGNIVVAGTAYTNGDQDYAVLRYTTAGTLDPTFDADGIRVDNVGVAQATAADAVLKGDGRLVVAGTLQYGSYVAARYTDTGQLDPTFGGGDGVAALAPGGSARGTGVALQGDGHLLVAGIVPGFPANRFGVARFDDAGAPDLSFGTNGLASAVVGNGGTLTARVLALPDGRVVLGGDCEYGPVGSTSVGMALVRFRADGTLDPTFGDLGTVILPFGTISEGLAVARQPDGRVLIAGLTLPSSTGNFRMAVVRVDTTGVPDPTFGSGGYFSCVVGTGNAIARALALEPDGRILVAGEAVGTGTDYALLRLTPQGALDPSFDGDGIALTTLSLSGNDAAYGIALQPDGRILATGSSWDGAKTVFSVARFDSTGQLDPGYGDSGVTLVSFPGSHADAARAVVLDAQGRALLAGDTDGQFGIARLQGDEPSAVGTGEVSSPATRLRALPNPFHRATALHYFVEHAGPVRLLVFNASGALVRTLDDAPRTAGWQHSSWDGADNTGRPVPAGLYFLRLESAGRSVAAGRLVRLR